MKQLTLITVSIISMSSTTSAAEMTIGSGEDAVIVVRGQTASRCPTKQSGKKKLPVGGKWLALSSDEIRPTKLFVNSDGVSSNRSDESYFFRGIPILAGAVVNGRIDHRKINTSARSEYDITLGKQRYRFIEWGAIESALQLLSPEGKVTKTYFSDSETKTIPPHAYKISKEIRDNYEGGTMGLIRAGDFNGDGKVDLLIGYSVKEADGLMLWLSDPKTGNYVEPYASATEYGDCE
jgi:hypothetical protein